MVAAMEGLNDRRLVTIFSFVFFVTTLFVGCRRSAEPGGGTRVRIAVGGQAQLVYLPTTLARELGYYREEGLEIEIDDFQGGAKALEALLAGSADVVSGFYDHTIQMAAEGRAITAFVTTLRLLGFVLVVSPQNTAKITTIEELRDHIVGVSAAGSSTHMFLTYLLKQHGVPTGSVSVTAIGTAATAVAAVEYGKVDAAVMTEPAYTIMSRRNPNVRVLADLRRQQGVKEAFGTDTYPAAVLYSNAEWIRDNPDTARRLARAIKRTLSWMQEHTPQEIADKMPAEFRGEDPTLYVEALKSSMPMYSPDGMMAADGAESVHKVLVQSLDKVRDAKIDLAKTYTNEFVIVQTGR
jgi:NitT/TauT family transport system substrate-binding protein